MAVLPGPPTGHVRGPLQAIAIVDLADDGTSLPADRRRSKARGRATAAAIGAAIGLAAIIVPPLMQAPLAATAPRTSAAGAPAAVAAVVAPTIVALRPLALPFGITDADLSSMPDRYVNEPLPASFRVVITVRGKAAVASVETPSTIIWTEDGLHYSLTSGVRSIPQLVELANRLR